MTQQQALKLFEEKKVRTVWDTDTEKWYFSIVDVVSVLTDSDYQTARKYWKVLKGRLLKEGNESVTNCYQLKLRSSDGKNYKIDVADTEQLFRIIQSIPSPKAEPFKQWMAQVASQRIDQMQDPELSINQAVADYRRMGYSEAWINQRIKSIEVRKALTDEWQRAGVKEGVQYACGSHSDRNFPTGKPKRLHGKRRCGQTGRKSRPRCPLCHRKRIGASCGFIDECEKPCSTKSRRRIA